MAHWQTPTPADKCVENATAASAGCWMLYAICCMDNSRHQQRVAGEKGRDALLVNKSFERIFTHNLSSLPWLKLTSPSEEKREKLPSGDLRNLSVHSGNGKRKMENGQWKMRPVNRRNLFTCQIQNSRILLQPKAKVSASRTCGRTMGVPD